jgi:hypothetical protein
MWAGVMQQLGVKHKMATAFHPQSNGMIERFHRRLKEALKARAASSDWDSHLPWVMLGVRTAPRRDSAVSAAELVYGAALVVPAQFITTAEPPPEAFVRQLQAGVPCAAPHRYPGMEAALAEPPDAALMKADFVYVKSPPAATGLSPAYRGPYAVHKKSPKFFIIKVGGQLDAVSYDRLKPHLGGQATPAEPPRRGRPPGRTQT